MLFDASRDAAAAAARAARRAQAAARCAAIVAGLDPDFDETPAEAQWQPPLIEPGPCDDRCRFRDRCGQGLLACEAFSVYVAGQGAPRWRLAPRVPTRARYAAIFGDQVSTTLR